MGNKKDAYGPKNKNKKQKTENKNPHRISREIAINFVSPCRWIAKVMKEMRLSREITNR